MIQIKSINLSKLLLLSHADMELKNSAIIFFPMPVPLAGNK